MLFHKTKTRIHPRLKASLSGQFTTKELVALDKYGTVIDVSDGHTLTFQGEPAQEAMMVIAGTVEVRDEDSNVSVAGPGEFFGTESLKNRAPRSNSSTTIEESSVLVFSSLDFRTMIHYFPSLESAISTTAVPQSDKVIDLTETKTNSVATHRLPSAA